MMAEANLHSEDNSLDKKVSLYFVIKCASLESLQKCISSGEWAFRERAKPPQPQDILEKAHSKSGSKVILVFSVNNQHGWHGYCESLFPSKPAGIESRCPDTSNSDGEWFRFTVKWVTHFQSLSSYACLPLDKTKDMTLLDNSPVNQARNWQEMSQQVGSLMCELIDRHFTEIRDRKIALENERIEEIKAKESFFQVEENLIGLCEDISIGWRSIIEKVESDLGKVVLACPFGSQRYNCSLPDSDSDILIIYQAKTVDLLGLERPPQTIKNSHTAKMDYTVLELQRYCELLTAGDPRCIETLFIEEEESVLAFASESWKKLCGVKRLLLTQDCLEKYVREAKGTKGLKQFDKWKSEMKADEKPPQKMNKLAYIILRLLQSGRDIVREGCIQVYRKDNSVEKQELLDARLGRFSVSKMADLFDRYICEIEECKATSSFSEPDAAKMAVQHWLVETRLKDLGVVTKDTRR